MVKEKVKEIEDAGGASYTYRTYRTELRNGELKRICVCTIEKERDDVLMCV